MATFRISSEAELVEVVRTARESKCTLEIIGHGTKRGFGRPAECDDVLDLSGVAGIVSYEPDEMIITARAGTPVAEIETALAEKNQRLGFEPADWGPLFGGPANSATIGGVLSADANGSAAIRYGRCRDHLLGFRAVNGFGEAYKGGGKVVKNVTGFDLPKLFCGAMGTLGPLTEVTLRVFPKPELEWLIAVKDLPPEHALALMRAISASLISPTALCYVPAINNYTSPRAPRNIPELSRIGAGAVLVRLDGWGAALAEKRAALRAVVGQFHLVDLAGEDSIRRIDAGSMFGDSPLDVWRFDVPTTSVVPLIAKAQPAEWAADWGGSRVYLARTPGYYGQREHANAAEFEGSCILLRASAETRKRAQVFASNAQPLSALIVRVKAAFDPLHLFNPGRMWEGV